jgi:SPX domain protein involved in polyphosphate accumulation
MIWLQAFQSSGLMAEVPKFSKFLHGMALLHPHLVRNTPSW